MDHVVIPIGHDHLRTIELLAAGAATAAGVELPVARSSPRTAAPARPWQDEESNLGAL
jgi:hypothetical protein